MQEGIEKKSQVKGVRVRYESCNPDGRAIPLNTEYYRYRPAVPDPASSKQVQDRTFWDKRRILDG
jgi:hypothetical protein